MTNEQIIYEQSKALAEAGIIKYTGRELKVQLLDGGEMVIKETEAIHTFQTWKDLGFMVKKGEHAIAKFPIWKFSKRKDDDDEDHIFMKTASWFSESQVEPIPA